MPLIKKDVEISEADNKYTKRTTIKLCGLTILKKSATQPYTLTEGKFLI